jgi:hypothetical protein
MNRKTILGAIFAVVIVGVILLLSLALDKRPLNITQVNKVSNKLTTAAAYTSDSFVYINGKAIVQYDYVTGKSTDLSSSESQNGLAASDSLSVSSDNHYILFHNEYAPLGGILNTTLVQSNLNETLDYWWVFNVQTKTFQPLPQGILIAKFDGDKIYTLSAADSISETITTYNASNLQKTASLNVPSSSNFFVANGGYLLETTNNNVLFTKNGVVSTQLFSSTNIIGVTPNHQWAVATTGQASAHPLIAINLQNDASKTISIGVTGQTAWLNSGTVLYTTGNPTIDADTMDFNSYNVNTNKNTAWSLPQSLAAPSNPPLTAALLLGQTTALISDSASNYQLIGTSTVPAKNL